MKTQRIKTSFLLLALQLFVLISLQAQTNKSQNDSPENVSTTVKNHKEKLTGYIEMNYYRHYLWRGAIWGNNDVSQPELHLDYGNFSFALCANLNLLPKNLSSEYYKRKVIFDEQDIELGYQKTFGKLDFQVLLWGYFYFNQINTPNTGEFYTKLEYPVWKNTKIFTENVIDFASYKGAYFNSSGIHFEKDIKNLLIEYKLFTGFANSKFNNAYYEINQPTLNFIGTSLNLEYSFKNNLYLAAKGEFNQYTSKEIKLSTGLNKTDNFSIYFGLEF